MKPAESPTKVIISARKPCKIKHYPSNMIHWVWIIDAPQYMRAAVMDDFGKLQIIDAQMNISISRTDY